MDMRESRRSRKRIKRTLSICACPSNPTAVQFRRTAHTFTRLFRESLDSGRLNRRRSVRTLMGWAIRRHVMGHDYSYGALESIQSFLSPGLKATFDCEFELAATPERERQSLEVAGIFNAWRDLDDGRSSSCIMLYCRGHWRILCNERFETAFATGEEIERRVEEERVLPSFFFGSTVSADDQGEFVQLLAGAYLAGDGVNEGEHSAVLKCIDRHGASFLALVAVKIVCLGVGDNIGLRVSILPLPRTRYLPLADMCAAVMGGEARPGNKDPTSFN